MFHVQRGVGNPVLQFAPAVLNGFAMVARRLIWPSVTLDQSAKLHAENVDDVFADAMIAPHSETNLHAIMCVLAVFSLQSIDVTQGPGMRLSPKIFHVSTVGTTIEKKNSRQDASSSGLTTHLGIHAICRSWCSYQATNGTHLKRRMS